MGGSSPVLHGRHLWERDTADRPPAREEAPQFHRLLFPGPQGYRGSTDRGAWRRGRAFSMGSRGSGGIHGLSTRDSRGGDQGHVAAERLRLQQAERERAASP
jgi:hypothetical protein